MIIVRIYRNSLELISIIIFDKTIVGIIYHLNNQLLQFNCFNFIAFISYSDFVILIQLKLLSLDLMYLI